MSLVLRPVEGSDYPALYRLERDPDRFVDWRFRGMSLSPLQFGALNGRGLLRHYLLVDDAPRALVALHSLSARDETAELAIVHFDPKPSIAMGAAVALVLDEGFDLGLRTVYAEVAGFNLAAIAPLLKLFFECESVRREAEYHRGRYWDHHVFALRRERWITDVRPWLDRARALVDFRSVGLSGLMDPGPSRAK